MQRILILIGALHFTITCFGINTVHVPDDPERARWTENFEKYIAGVYEFNPGNGSPPIQAVLRIKEGRVDFRYKLDGEINGFSVPLAAWKTNIGDELSLFTINENTWSVRETRISGNTKNVEFRSVVVPSSKIPAILFTMKHELFIEKGWWNRAWISVPQASRLQTLEFRRVSPTVVPPEELGIIETSGPKADVLNLTFFRDLRACLKLFGE